MKERRVKEMETVKHDVRKEDKNEVSKAMRRMKNRKEAGPDDILVEVLKCRGERAGELNIILDSENMPEKWRKCVLVLIKIKWNVQSCSSRRGIKLISNMKY